MALLTFFNTALALMDALRTCAARVSSISRYRMASVALRTSAMASSTAPTYCSSKRSPMPGLPTRSRRLSAEATTPLALSMAAVAPSAGVSASLFSWLRASSLLRATARSPVALATLMALALAFSLAISVMRTSTWLRAASTSSTARCTDAVNRPTESDVCSLSSSSSRIASASATAFSHAAKLWAAVPPGSDSASLRRLSNMAWASAIREVAVASAISTCLSSAALVDAALLVAATSSASTHTGCRGPMAARKLWSASGWSKLARTCSFADSAASRAA